MSRLQLAARVRSTRVLAVIFLSSCSGGSGHGPNPGLPITPGAVIGGDHAGNYHLGPVDFAETVWPNACAPYPATIQSITGDMIAGVSDSIAAPGSLCDACVEVTTGRGRSAILRVITYGVSNGPGDLDVSPEAYALLNEGEDPRAMSWHLIACENGAPISIQFQGMASQWWTSFWVRNPSMAIDHVEVRRSQQATFETLSLGTDGTYTYANGVGTGAFTIRVVGATGATYDVQMPEVVPGALIATAGNLPIP